MKLVLLIVVHRLDRVQKGPKRKPLWRRVFSNPTAITVLTAFLAFLTALLEFVNTLRLKK